MGNKTSDHIRATKGISYYTVDTGCLAPYPDMTHEALNDFEDWCGLDRTPMPDPVWLAAWSEVQAIAPE